MVSTSRLLFLATFLGGRVQSLEAPIDGYDVVHISWEVEISPGGPKTVLQGTVEEIYAQLVDINPNYEADFASVPHKREDDAGAWNPLDKRDDVLCNLFESARVSAIKDGIKYLKRIGGQPVNGPGPGKCSRVSCSYFSAIWWCSDVPFRRYLPGFYNIADGAQMILDQCVHKNMISGQDFHNDFWNVIVAWGTC